MTPTKVTMATLKRLRETFSGAEYMNLEHALVSRAWDLVAPYPDWRAEICITVGPEILAASEFSIEVIQYAVQYFTATECAVESMPDGTIRFRAKGYRAGPAGP